MTRIMPTACLALGLLPLTWFPYPAQAVLLDDFDPAWPNVTATQLATAPGPSVQPGGPSGNYLRLVYDSVNAQSNHYTYDLTDVGAYDTLKARWAFRLSSPGNPAADGYHFALVPTRDFGPSGDGPPIPAAEEPNWPGVLAVGMDIYPPEANDVSLHWNGFELVNVPVPTGIVTLDNQLFHQAELFLERAGNCGLATLVLTPDIYGTPGSPYTAFKTMVPLMIPYENRVQFGGRTGGLNVDIDLDDIRATYSDPYLPLPAISGTYLIQDFDSAGTTPFTVRQHATSATASQRPGVLPISDDPANGTFARLIHDGVANNRNSLTFARTATFLSPARRYAFDFRIDSAGWPSDGLGIALLPTALYGLEGPGPDLGAFEKPNLSDTLAVGFDLYPAESVNDISVHWDGTELKNATLDPAALDLDNGLWNRAEMILAHAPGGTRVTVQCFPDIHGAGGPPVTALDSILIPGVPVYDHRLQFGARSGGLSASIDLDDVVELGPVWPFGPERTLQGFDGGGTYYEVWPAPGGAPRGSELRTGGPTDFYLHLIDDAQMNHRQAVTFDATPQGKGVTEGQSTFGHLDFRAASPGSPDNPGDGFAVLLIPVGLYGDTGPGAVYQTDPTGVEKPNIPGVLGFGFDLYPEPDGVNDCTLHWDGAQVAFTRVPDADIDLDAGVFHRMEFRVDWTDTGSTVSLLLRPGVHGPAGTPFEVFDQWFIPGLKPFAFRVEIAARSGGATMDLDLDNILVQTGDPRTSHGTPIAWLEAFGYTGHFEEADLENPDQDLYLNWQEYQLDFHPQVSNLPWTVNWDGPKYIRFESSSNRLYRVQGRASVNPLAWDDVTETNGTGGSISVLVSPFSNRFYRAEVRAP